ncbi:flagellar biosynthesis protein FlhA [Leeia sp. TBRC 13508]|uniref:Flagellar biosynthesis protein FlhA n=1 Tax=Leeia speluncae TaxID=2884804 RepID=A0ABS8D670_9NEIS|nr:flagellar biosynthesis protein FlhA [Leeia speluncae]MCB6183704.1 flagellar biosynthesis protein FlhA [Leeia speluncae]
MPKLNLSKLAGPILIIMILSMMILPLPSLILDFLFTFNIAMSIIVLMVSLYTMKPLEFSAFPTVLLLTTLLRLSLNVASTRVILLDGHTGPDAAGKVVEAFGHFLVGGNYAIGILVFIILVVINFAVITKGAGRIAEVSARFTLDAMPGKQMAIDADLNAGLIGEEEARKRRTTIAQEAEFFGSMDGASKFVRGDAVAGIIIMLLNVIGGLFVGMLQHDLAFGDAAKTYTLLTIGDGLVAQIPSLIISTAAGIVVTRVDTNEDISTQMLGQLFKRGQVLYITAGLLGLFGIIPNMPHMAFLVFAAGIAAIGYQLDKRAKAEASKPAPPPPAPTAAAVPEVSWADVQPVDMIGLEVGYRLIPLVDRNQDGELLRKIRGIRKKIAQDLGFLVPAVHIRDNLELKPNTYRLALKGVEVAEGEAFTGMLLAINPGRVHGQLTGTQTKDPAFGLPAVWIDANKREEAQMLGYTVVDTSTVIGTHLSNVIQSHAAELLGREEVQQLLDHVGKQHPKLIEDLIPKVIPLGILHRVLQGLLLEEVHIRDMRTILETLAEWIPKQQNPEELIGHVRVALGRAIVQQAYSGFGIKDTDALPVLALDPNLENILLQATQTKGAEGAGFEPSLADNLLQQTVKIVQQREQSGQPSVLMVPGPLRGILSRFLRRAIPSLKILSHSEVPDTRSIQVVAIIGGRG